jgi:hypothetical protein
VYLYTHWGATELAKKVQEAIAKKWRWDDPEYLARIIFDCMKGNDIDSGTGYGIGTKKHGDIWCLITVDCKSQTVIVEEYGKLVYRSSFREFVNTDFDSDMEEAGKVVGIKIIKTCE